MKRPLVEMAPTVSRINVTPIIDVALVLVIIMLITAPMIAMTDMEIALPAAKTRSTSSEARINVTLGVDGAIAIDDETIDRANLVFILVDRIASGEKDVIVVIRADEGVPYDQVELLLKQAKGAGAKRLAFATRQQEKAKK